MTRRFSLLFLLLLGGGATQRAQGCACGCGVFDVGTSSMFPSQAGSIVFFEFDVQNQDRNWKGDSPSSAQHNEDKRVFTRVFSVGFQHMFNRVWGVQGNFPYVHRRFKATDEDSGVVLEYAHESVGDIRLRALYTGFSEDMSTGLTFGMKLPTGSTKFEHFDPDVQIGSGSTDFLVGGYHRGAFSSVSAWQYFVSAEGSVPIVHDHGYIPGSEINASVGAYYNRLRWRGTKFSPWAKLIGTHRWSDSGALALSESTGYSRVLAGPGLEIGWGAIRLDADAGFRLYQHTTGEQLVSSPLLKVNLSYRF